MSCVVTHVAAWRQQVDDLSLSLCPGGPSKKKKNNNNNNSTTTNLPEITSLPERRFLMSRFLVNDGPNDFCLPRKKQPTTLLRRRWNLLIHPILLANGCLQDTASSLSRYTMWCVQGLKKSRVFRIPVWGHTRQCRRFAVAESCLAWSREPVTIWLDS
ncbi:hypothetical protein LY78DRAFT_299974 [Colletotrichum sublineola]|nr:hypothetical protein LY78DRAFT_299974 [Colletotrichum sublineola]